LVSQLPEASAGHRRSLGSPWRNHRKIRLVLKHQSAGAKHAFFPDGDMIANRDVHAHETSLSDAPPPGHDNLRGHENVVFDGRMVTDVVAAPQRDIGANAGKGLDRVVLEDEAILFQFKAGKYRRAAAQIGYKPIAPSTGGGHLFGANGVEPSVADGNEHAMLLGRKLFTDLFERQHGTTAEFRLLQVCAIDRESDDFEVGIVREVEVRQFGDLASPENDNFLFVQSIWPPPQDSCISYLYRAHGGIHSRFWLTRRVWSSLTRFAMKSQGNQLTEPITAYRESHCPFCNGKAIALSTPHPDRSMISDGRVVPQALRKMSCVKCGAASHAADVSPQDIRTIYDSGYTLAGSAPKSDAGRARAYGQWIQSECVAPRSILEVGCGSGALLRELSVIWPEASCFGIDPALPHPDRSDHKLRLEQGFIEDVPGEVGKFDLIVAVNVIEHTAHPGRFLATLQSRLAADGKIVIVCPAADPPNLELLFFDHLYSLTANALGAVAAATPLVLRKQSFAAAAIGDFQMLVFDTADRVPELPLRQHSFYELWSERQSYLDGWIKLDQALLDRSRSVTRLVAFGGGQTAALLRAYAPRTWARVELILLDDENEAWSLDTPIASYANAVQNLGSRILIATSPRVQNMIADRLRSDGLPSIRWDDLIAN
jgi:SAM-dependent methyltransferase